jgi:hypothetical protein
MALARPTSTTAATSNRTTTTSATRRVTLPPRFSLDFLKRLFTPIKRTTAPVTSSTSRTRPPVTISARTPSPDAVTTRTPDFSLDKYKVPIKIQGKTPSPDAITDTLAPGTEVVEGGAGGGMDTKTMALIGVAALVVVGGIAMWSRGGSRQTSPVYRNPKRRRKSRMRCNAKFCVGQRVLVMSKYRGETIADEGVIVGRREGFWQVKTPDGDTISTRESSLRHDRPRKARRNRK